MSTPERIRQSSVGLDLSQRVAVSTTVAASPTDNTETVIASITITQNLAVATGVLLLGWCAYTVGTNGVSTTLQIKQTATTGAAKGSTGATTAVAANVATRGVVGFDTAPTLPGQVYVLTLTVGSANAGSTVSAVRLFAVIV